MMPYLATITGVRDLATGIKIGGAFVCTDGPVLCFAEVERFLEGFV